MHISKTIRSTTFAEVNRGNIIRFFAQDKLCMGMKIYRDSYDAVLFLEPPLNYKLADIVCLIGEPRPWDDDVMLEFPDAALVRKDFSRLPDGQKPSTGQLIISDDGRTMLLCKMSMPVYVDMDTGRVFKCEEMTPSIVVSKWEILLKSDANHHFVEF